MPDSEKAWAFLRDSDLITSAAEVRAAVDRLAAEIERVLGKRYPLVLAVMGGAVVFAGQILPKLRFPLDFDYVHASRYGAATRGAGIEWRVRPPE
ncbi:MAG TPA: hypoxanthine-guanine phosphoribosyltransferase, partial [Burkholderiales bacterium]